MLQGEQRTSTASSCPHGTAAARSLIVFARAGRKKQRREGVAVESGEKPAAERPQGVATALGQNAVTGYVILRGSSSWRGGRLFGGKEAEARGMNWRGGWTRGGWV